MPAGLEIALLGPLEVRVNGDVAPLPGVSQRIVLARLALAPGRVVPTSQLVDALWPHKAPENATGNLHSYVSRLRRVVGGDQVAREPAGYRLQVEAGQVDIGRVEQLVADARDRAAGDPLTAAGLLTEALSMWRGEPLSDLGDAIAFAPERARFSEWRRQLVAECFELRVASGQGADALPELEEEATATPADERLHLLLMRALHQLGRTAEALRVADGFRRRTVDETGLDPSPALAELERRLLVADPELQPAPARARPPRAASRRRAPADRFVGRDRELDEVAVALRDNRAVTIVGPGGVGKTRVMLELLDRLAGAQEVHLVELAEVPDGADVERAVAASLGLNAASSGTDEAIADRLAQSPCVLALDNCEHVLRSVSEFVSELLRRDPELRVLATSRQRLATPGERVIRLGPLARDEQIELFCDRASLLRSDFEASGPQVDVVAEICGLVDGLPLAVELSARREAVFGLTQLRDRLSAGLDVLEPLPDGDRATAVTATVEWSYRLLSPDARAMFDRLAVCRGGITLDALTYIAPGDRRAEAVLADLVEASLVVADLSATPPRYRLLETMRAVALGHMDPASLVDASAAHAAWMQTHAETIYRHDLEQSEELGRLVRNEVVNLRDALAWLIDGGRWGEAGRLGSHLALAMAHFHHLELLSELRRLEAGATAEGVTGGLCAMAAGAAAWVEGDTPTAERLLTESFRLLPADHAERWKVSYFRMVNRMFSGDRHGVEADASALLAAAEAPRWPRATAVCCAALINLYRGDRDVASRWMSSHTELLDEVAAKEGFIGFVRGEILVGADPAAALGCYEEAERQCAVHGHVYARELARIGRLAVLIRLGRPDATWWCEEVIESLRSAGMWTQMWTALRLTAELLAAVGDLEPVALLLAAADADPLAPAVVGPDLARHDALRSRLAQELEPDLLARITQAGRTAGRAGAVAAALAALERHR